jgi:hypothetical protein
MRKHLVIIMSLVFLATAAITASAAGSGENAVAGLRRPGSVVLGGGTNGYGWLPVYASSGVTTNSVLGIYAWGGGFITGTTELGPYLDINYYGSSSSTYIDPGIQAGFFFDAESVGLFIRSIAALELHIDSSSPSSPAFSLSGFWETMNFGVVSMLSSSVALSAGPALNFWMSIGSDYMDLKVGFLFGLMVFL